MLVGMASSLANVPSGAVPVMAGSLQIAFDLLCVHCLIKAAANRYVPSTNPILLGPPLAVVEWTCG